MTNELAMPDTTALSAESHARIEKAKMFTVRTAEDHVTAALEDKALIALIKKVDETFDPIVESAKSNYDAARAGRDMHRKPLMNCRALYKSKMGAWEEEEERKRIERQRKLQEEADRKERERQEKAAEEARKKAEADAKERAAIAAKLKADGDKKAAAEAMKAAEAKKAADLAAASAMAERAKTATARLVEVESKVPDTAGVSSREQWYAEVTDLVALERHVAAHSEDAEYLAPVMPVLNKMAQAKKDRLAIPGVVARKKTVVSNRA